MEAISCSSVSGFSPGKNADVGHANHRQPVPAFGAQSSAGAVLADSGAVSRELRYPVNRPLRDDGSALRRHAFVIEGKSSKTRAVLLARVGNYVHQIAAIAQIAQLVQSKKRCAGEIRFHAQHAIEFNGMSDRLVNLQSELRAFENNVKLRLPDTDPPDAERPPLRQCGGHSPPASILRSARILCSATARQTNLDTTASEFRFRQRRSRISCAGGELRLMNVRALRGEITTAPRGENSYWFRPE